MMINPVEILFKTAANYVAFKSVKGSVDYVWDKEKDVNQNTRAAQCMFCLNIWANNPSRCPHCNCKVLKKLFKEYDFKKHEDDFNIDAALTMGNRL